MKSADCHLRLFSSVTEEGNVGAVFDMESKNWISDEWASDLEDGKRKAEKIAQSLLRTLPPIEWKKSF